LYALSIELFTATNRVGALGEATGRALTLLGAREGGLVLFDGSPDRQRVISWHGDKPDEIEDLIAGVGRHKEPLEFSSPLGRDVYLPLLVGGRTRGALVARGTGASRQALVSASRLVGLAVEREQFIEQNAHVQALRGRRIDNLRAMARLEAGKAKPRREPTPLADLFRAVRENLPLVFQARPVTVHVDEDCPDANVDPSLALEILMNLIENAHRVSPPGAPVELLARRHPLDPNRVRVEVLDRGPGVPAGVADEDGNLLAGATTDIAQTGLGLEIARSLATANGGMITISPRLGGGTAARVDVPAADLRAGVEP
jgi:signal transduction histidine kinase